MTTKTPGACCGKSAKTPQRFLIRYSDGKTEERSSLAAARIRASRDPKATIEPIES
jgi:hypothetical protein